MDGGIRECTRNMRQSLMATIIGFTLGLLIAGSLWPSISSAQAVPPRGYQLQEFRQISPSPLSTAQRVRREIIRATNPYTGQVDVRVLSRPDVPRPGWFGPSRSGNPQAVSRPDVPRPTWEGPSRSGTPVASPVPPQKRPSFSSGGSAQGTKPKPVLMKPMIPVR